MTDNVFIKDDDCIGCGTCVEMCPEVFDFDDSETKALVKTQADESDECIQNAIESCPAQCIYWTNEENGESDESEESEPLENMCFRVFAFNEYEEMNEVILPEGSIDDCLENALTYSPDECLDLLDD